MDRCRAGARERDIDPASFTVREPQAKQIVRDLLWNVYRAFDYRGEARVYDLLARSVSGEMLEQTYLETRRALELRQQGGARVRIQQVEVRQLSIQQADASGFRALCVWDAAGSVAHWGHTHQRRNRYRASITVRAESGAWKMIRLDMQNEERL